MSNVKETFKVGGRYFMDLIDKNAPSILTAVGSIGLAVSLIKVAFDTKKFYILKEEKLAEMDSLILPPKEWAVIFVKSYGVTIAVVGASFAAIFAANHEHLRREALIIAAYEMKDGKLKEYKDAVLKTVGEKKEEEIQATQAKQIVSQNPPPKEIYIKDSMDIWVFDKPNGRYVQCNKSKIEKAVVQINKMINMKGRQCLNDFYEELDWDFVDDGYRKGWDLMQYGENLEVTYSYAGTPSGEPCLVIDYDWEIIPDMWSE